MFTKIFPIDDEIIRLRTGLSTGEYLEGLLSFLSKEATGKDILYGLGEVLDEKRKIWAKNNLVRELCAQIMMFRENSTNGRVTYFSFA
jgi:calcineurin-like phosphoesterase family protein